MEELNNYYLQVIANLKTLQTDKLTQERLLPLTFAVCKKKKETTKSRKLAKKKERQRAKIEQGYFKGVEDSLKIVNKIYKVILKHVEKD